MINIIPENIKGKSLDIEHHVVETTLEEANKTFVRASARLVNPPVWHMIAGELSAKFKLYNSEDLNGRLVIVDDYLAIDVPGPGLKTGEGYDWVRVEMLEKNIVPHCDNSVAMRLRTSTNPTTRDTGIAHFFTNDATSTFIIKRNGNKVSASYHGRNEIPNTTDISLVDKLRNTVVSAGAEAGLSNLHWDALIKGFLQPEIGG